MDTPLWKPAANAAQDSNMACFMAHMDEKGLAETGDAEALHRFSIAEPETFWSALWNFCGVRGDKGEAPYLVDGDKMPGARFFPGATLNFAENLLNFDGGDTPALIYLGED
ncbi:MAG: acetoacetate--CoA ligase, partial [Hyphomicrobiaceae bacterium]|nr:acetoacetate--CoA ligase [Hyphomicrobiaceae bacterium]